ncbi:hypothetical protein M917_1366 [Psychrobacter aquaticus CMS 56]|uniref:Uncharacterized protein n=1 Tax=Psychrobacter aquaticus CMS 56 TaxID=1354303 RepID=U4TAA3_9GAMM|nr:hypothetical protein M917_1366 [Psychrobacter aquaticus CMS 56]
MKLFFVVLFLASMTFLFTGSVSDKSLVTVFYYLFLLPVFDTHISINQRPSEG